MTAVVKEDLSTIETVQKGLSDHDGWRLGLGFFFFFC